MHRIFEINIEIFGWIKIVLSPTLIDIRFVCIYYFYPNNQILLASILIAVISFIIGINWETKKN